MNKDQYYDEGPPRKYWIQLPNMIDDSNLDVYEFRLYAHYKRVAGDNGKCWQSKAAVATLCGMSAGKASQATRSLETRGLITIEEVASGRGQPYHIIRIVDIWPRNMALYAQGSQGKAISSPGELIDSQDDAISSPGEIKNNPLRKTGKKNEKETTDFLSQTKKSDRERIRDILVDVLADGEMPGTDYLLRPFADAVDALVIEFRKIEGKSRLDDDLTSKIIGAIRAAYEDENNWQFNKTTSPTRAVIACIVAQGRANKDKAQARSELAEAAAHSQQALAERQAERQPPTDQEVWWGQVLGELKLQMTTPTFNTWLKDTVLLERANGRVVVGVANAYALDWLENRLKGMVERSLVGFGVSEVEFELLPSGGESP